ncbi:MAG TPA: non-ribosomal peptide synthetase, partial [Calditrichae bacterium]|nr:non-ribosomal peptide synthetase [Calditrichia bacterium]
MTNKATTTSKKKNIEAIYPLTPLQEGMLFHAIMDPHSGVYFEQMSVTFRGKVNEDAFRKAWQFIIDRHQILRTAFVYRKVEKPVQVVHRTVPLPLQVLDWRDRSPEEQEKELVRFLEEDRRRGFKLNQAPLMRFYLIYLDDDRVEFVWSQHHLTMDGWSRPILLKEVFAAYDAFSQGQTPQLPPVRPYKQYIQWLKRQDEKAAEQFWKELLRGFTAPTPLNIDTIPGDEKGRRDYDRVAVSLSAGLSSAVEQLARENQITVNTILQSAWALLLSYYAGQDDVVFGATVSGRPPEIPGVEEMVGMFINTLPVRVRIRPGQSVREWLAENQALMVKMRQFEYTPLVKVQNWSDVPAGTPLFDSIFVFENYPVDRAMNERQMALDVESVKTHARTNFPLTIVAAPGENIHLLVAFDATRFGRQTIERLLSHMENILRGFVEDPDQPVVRIPIVSAEEQQTILSALTGKTVSLPEGETIVSRFEQIVAEHAEATAAVFHHPDSK